MKGYVIAVAVAAGACLTTRFASPPAGGNTPGPNNHTRRAPECEAIAARSAEKDRLYRRLIAGEVALADAVRRAVALDRDWPEVRPEWYDHCPGRSLGERVAWVIVTMASELPADPGRAAVVERLECEAAALADLGPGWEFAPVNPGGRSAVPVAIVTCE